MASQDAASLNGYFPAPYSLDPLPHNLRSGLVAPALMGLLSAMSTLALITFILYRMASWRQHYKSFIGYNQYVMLVLMLLIADFQQSTAFLISWYWIAKHMIVAPTSACFAQGWLLHSGDVSSALFVVAIAVHTFLTAVLGKLISNRVFYSAVLALWILAYLLTIIGVAMHPQDYFVRAGAWCWVSSKYENERLFLHYFWIFLVEFAIVVIYSFTFLLLRHKTNRLFKAYRANPDTTNPQTVAAVNRVTMLMVLYPCVYILLTLPLSAGRMWSMAHNAAQTSDAFSCTAGALLASCGWADALLYTLTRKKLLADTTPGKSRNRSHDLGGITTTRTITVQDFGHAPSGEMSLQEFLAAGPRIHQRGEDEEHRPLVNGSSRSMLETPSSNGGLTKTSVSSLEGEYNKARQTLGLDDRASKTETPEPVHPPASVRTPAPVITSPKRMVRDPWD